MRMGSFILLTAFAVVQTYASSLCALYREDGTLEDKVCARMEAKDNVLHISLKECTGKICIFSQETYGGRCVEYFSGLYPGEKCEKPEECLTGKSKDGFCAGETIGTSCTGDVICESGSYCDNKSKVCTAVVAESGDCSGGQECSVGLMCDGTKCVKMFSIEKGKESALPALCETFYIREGKCADGPFLKRKDGDPSEEPTVCIEECNYEYKEAPTQGYSTKCACGKSDKETLYCNPGIGEINFDNVFSLINL
eukprot:TRINITY_DN5998_c0_g1_i12.p1 TRINITY_DN5998_c0_g1~~TRINITY_DN5998_c0_g1_i12.p1  ORF type:complete len:253 (+),score=56.56 TRINITY_DN5998_c0_g1_i12:267-1025(+)